MTLDRNDRFEQVAFVAEQFDHFLVGQNPELLERIMELQRAWLDPDLKAFYRGIPFSFHNLRIQVSTDVEKVLSRMGPTAQEVHERFGNRHPESLYSGAAELLTPGFLAHSFEISLLRILDNYEQVRRSFMLIRAATDEKINEVRAQLNEVSRLKRFDAMNEAYMYAYLPRMMEAVWGNEKLEPDKAMAVFGVNLRFYNEKGGEIDYMTDDSVDTAVNYYLSVIDNVFGGQSDEIILSENGKIYMICPFMGESLAREKVLELADYLQNSNSGIQFDYSLSLGCFSAIKNLNALSQFATERQRAQLKPSRPSRENRIGIKTFQSFLREVAVPKLIHSIDQGHELIGFSGDYFAEDGELICVSDLVREQNFLFRDLDGLACDFLGESRIPYELVGMDFGDISEILDFTGLDRIAFQNAVRRQVSELVNDDAEVIVGRRGTFLLSCPGLTRFESNEILILVRNALIRMFPDVTVKFSLVSFDANDEIQARADYSRMHGANFASRKYAEFCLERVVNGLLDRLSKGFYELSNEEYLNSEDVRIKDDGSGFYSADGELHVFTDIENGGVTGRFLRNAVRPKRNPLPGSFQSVGTATETRPVNLEEVARRETGEGTLSVDTPRPRYRDPRPLAVQLRDMDESVNFSDNVEGADEEGTRNDRPGNKVDGGGEKSGPEEQEPRLRAPYTPDGEALSRRDLLLPPIFRNRNYEKPGAGNEDGDKRKPEDEVTSRWRR